MYIYVTHSRKFEFKNDLYRPIRESPLNKLHHFIFPHQESDLPFDSKSLMDEGKLGLVIGEASYSSSGQGVEFGWADDREIPIVLLYRSSLPIPSSSLTRVSSLWISYHSDETLIQGIEKAISSVKTMR